MDYNVKKANEIMDKMEVLLSNDDREYEEEEKLQEYFQDAKQNLDDAYDVVGGTNSMNKLKFAKKRFKQICSEFETSDDMRDIGMDTMFPDEEGMEGFDWTSGD